MCKRAETLASDALLSVAHEAMNSLDRAVYISLESLSP